MYELTELLNNPEDHYPGNFDTPQRANALLTGLCQDAAKEIAKLQAEVLEQCRVNGMSAEREDALAAELTRLKASIALDKMAENARELGLDYEPAPVQEKCFLCGERVASCTSDVCPKSAQPAPVQEPVAWMRTLFSPELGEFFDYKDGAFANETDSVGWTPLYTAPQPVPVKTYHDGKPWPVAPKPWVGLTVYEIGVCSTEAAMNRSEMVGGAVTFARAIEAKLKEKNHG